MLFSFHPLTIDRWEEFETLFGARGACGGCWCQAWRKGPKQFKAESGEGNRASMRALVEQGPPPGVLAYAEGQAVGWVAVAPRGDYPKLDRSRIFPTLDDTPVWSVSCLFISKGYRRQGLSSELLRAAAEFAFEQGAPAVEGYPNDLGAGDMLPDPFVWNGLMPAYLKAGFHEVARNSPKRPIVRIEPS